MPKRRRALPFRLFKSNHSKSPKRSLGVRVESSRKKRSASRAVDAFTSETRRAMSSPPCSRTEFSQRDRHFVNCNFYLYESRENQSAVFGRALRLVLGTNVAPEMSNIGIGNHT